MAGNARDPGVSVAARLLALVGVFDEKASALTLTELADGAELPIATAHRLVLELVEWGALVRAEDGRYVVGRRLSKLCGCTGKRR
ncbi:helix-turn-helix domain-containing protein [Rhodococcus sp. IEGM 1381]|uniref:helix-turn-helix domain-containing protein n=1 Tax=Rhodococcus sp. IEGM 1381 TaxID=3047085 RepID=UPI0024B6D6F7|nr:helix-turn-helix domain-containing protein [Rhodococcus sp. IEGM 1381]MDI9893270.1 helix-turn-helix domain-containing protein [Rhodococcus sp. IEGM 1381]